MKRFAIAALCALLPVWAQENPMQQLIEAARGGAASPELAGLVTKTLGPRGGTAVWGEDYLFVTDLSASAADKPVSASEA
ncbi:MAG: hypothetical protein JOZ45_13145, partial [Acidobacteriaceae bacterium]|nr:hypothetical protein [Acidobacteriaceae bacterium]